MRFLFFFLGFVVLGATLLAQQTPSFTLDIQGHQTWTVRLGFGNPELLRQEGITPGQPLLDQHLTAKVEGTVYRIVTVSGNFDSKLGPVFQDFKVTLDGERWKGVLGKFSLEGGGLARSRSLMGVRLSYLGDGFTVEGLASRAQGIPDVKVFKGTTELKERSFFLNDPQAPWRPASYATSLHGLLFWKLREPYIPGFSAVSFVLGPMDAFFSILDDYGLGYLREEFPEGFAEELKEGQGFLVLDDGGDVLLLKADPKGILRQAIRDAIEAYNGEHHLSGEEAKRYPFAEGSELEERFLGELLGLASMRVDEDDYPLSAAGKDRYLLLAKEVVPESLSLLVRGPGETDFHGLPQGFSYHLFPDQGILRLDFPDDFFRDDAALKVSFATPRGTRVFTLGAAVVPGSERVYRNGKRLTRGVDYSIDYQVPGILTLFKGLSEQETLRVEFERARGELGGAAPYQRDILGLSLILPSGARLRLLQAADEGRPSPTTAVMPNTHTVGGLELSGKEGEWDYRVVLGASENVYPPGDNRRIPARNRIEAIAPVEAPDGVYVVFGHRNGITVYHGGAFASYTRELGGRKVNALLYLPDEQVLLCGTNGGLTVVDLSLASPFDWVSSYRTLRKGERGEEGLPGQGVLVLAVGGDTVLLATEANLAFVPPGRLLEPKEWRVVSLPEGIEPTSLAWINGAVYLGTDQGLFRLQGEDWDPVVGFPWPVRDLLFDPSSGVLYIATPEGVRLLDPVGGRGLGWIGYGTDVHSLALWKGELLYGTAGGLFRAREGEALLEGMITALGAAGGSLWVGSEADVDYRLSLWRVSPAGEIEEFPQETTHIPGEDTSCYSDIPPTGHTARGVSAKVHLSRALPFGEVYLDLDTVWPGFQGIGMFGKADVHGIGMGLSFQGEGIQGELGGNFWVRKLFTSPEEELRGRLSLRWSPGPTLELSLTPGYRLLKEGRQFLLPYSLGSTWDLGGGRLSLGVNGQGAWRGRWEIQGSLRGNLQFSPFENWRVELSLGQPFSLPVRLGRGNISASLRGTGKLPGGRSWTLNWKEDIRITGSQPSGSRDISLDLSFPSFSWGGMQLASSLRPTWKDDGREWDLGLGANIRFKRGDLSVSLSPSFLLGQHRPSGTWRQGLSLKLWLRPPVLPWGKLELQGGLSWERLYNERYGERISLGGDLRLSLDLGKEGRMSLSWRKEGLDLNGSLRFPELWGAPDLSLKASLRGGKLKGSVALDLSRSLGGGWGVTLGGGYLFSLDGGWRQAGYIQLNADVSF